MSKQRINLGQIIVIAMLALAGAGAFLFGYTLEDKRDEAAIKSLVTGLADNLSKTETESTASALIKVKAVADAFADPMTLEMDKYAFGDYDRDRLLASIGRYRALVGSAKVTASDIRITITAKEKANGTFAGRFEGTLKSGPGDVIVKDIDAEFVKIDGRWKIKSLKFTNVLH